MPSPSLLPDGHYAARRRARASWGRSINKKAKPPLKLNYLKYYIGLTDGNRSRNFIYFVPRKQYIYVYAKVPDAHAQAQKLTEAGLGAGVDKYNGFVWTTIRPKEYDDASGVLADTVTQAVEEYSGE